MNKRHFIKSGLALGAAAIAAPYAGRTLAQQGSGFELIEPPLNTSVSDKVEVIEYFWFGCPHCFSFEPIINAWKEDKPDYVEFVRHAPPLNPSWETHSRAFYSAQALGITDEFMEPMFNAIHVGKRKMRSPKQIFKFVEELGFDPDEFEKTMDSFTVSSKIGISMQLAKDSGLSGVPAIVINGKYLTGSQLAGGYDNVIKIINQKSAEEWELMQAG